MPTKKKFLVLIEGRFMPFCHVVSPLTKVQRQGTPSGQVAIGFPHLEGIALRSLI